MPSKRGMREEIPSRLSEMLSGARRIKRIVEDLKDFARQDNSSCTEPVDINGVVRTAVRLVDNTIRKSTDNFQVSYYRPCTHHSKIMSLDPFKRKMGKMTRPAETTPESSSPESSVFVPQSPLPPIQDVADLLVTEAMRRANGNQSIACRLIGISQPALSKRLKKQKG